eukprot:CAMPEP_0179232482 /NCGR_PEP_ID=MMETSP0797-20121207/11881_1 /TAXON_ID=47934 /ORGANISM="Dinophysis acuminata, Strain DAEP01" /LENGTH=195 /DNA_ID=CAMNT_0020939601 /DNA_START=113 /DNA_END=698 /DNA_ORIENTATION=-
MIRAAGGRLACAGLRSLKIQTQDIRARTHIRIALSCWGGPLCCARAVLRGGTGWARHGVGAARGGPAAQSLPASSALVPSSSASNASRGGFRPCSSLEYRGSREFPMYEASMFWTALLTRAHFWQRPVREEKRVTKTAPMETAAAPARNPRKGSTLREREAKGTLTTRNFPAESSGAASSTSASPASPASTSPGP